MDERVGGGEQVAHLVGEADHAHAGIAAVAPVHVALCDLVVAAQGHHEHAVEAERHVGGAGQIAHAPAAARDHHDPAVLRELERAAGLVAVARVEHALHGEPARRLHAGAVAGHLAHLVDRLGVGDQVQVDPRVRPVAETRQVGDRRGRGYVEPPSAAQLAEHLGGARVGRHDDVGIVRADHPQQPARADHVDEAAGEPACGAPLEQPVLKVERPVHPRAENPARVVLEDDLEDAAHGDDAVDDLDVRVGALLLDSLGQNASR